MEWLKRNYIIITILVILFTIGGVFIYVKHKFIYTLHCEMTYLVPHPSFDQTDDVIFHVNLLKKELTTESNAKLILNDLYDRCTIDKSRINCTNENTYHDQDVNAININRYSMKIKHIYIRPINGVYKDYQYVGTCKRVSKKL